MTATTQPDLFHAHRSLLFSLAYRMLGSVTDAEDILQEAFVRWQEAALEEVRSPRAWLSATVIRLCIDELRRARVRRKAYPGIWLPEPLVGEATPAPDTALAESLNMALLALLERLTPAERAVFLLREVFDYEYDEIARLLDRSEAACRQLLRRARVSIASGRPRFDTTVAEQQQLTNRFVETLTTGDLAGLESLLAADVVSYSDGGGRVAAATRPVVGSERVARLLLGLSRRAPPECEIRVTAVNGGMGFVVYVAGRPFGVFALQFAEGKVGSIRVVVNPDKLRHIPPLPE